MIIYLIKCTIAMGVAWLIYRGFLVHQKSFVLNRIYVLTAIIGSTLAPFIMLPVALPKLAITDNLYPLGDLLSPTNTEAINNSAGISVYSFSDFITWIIITISILFALRFIYRMFKLLGLTRVSSVENKEGIRIAIINDGRTPFSFFNTMYIDQPAYTKGIDNAVFLHEKYHIQHWHSIDRILVEIISIVQWMNPFLYLLKRDLIDNHEYAADAYAIRQTNDSQSYLSLIISKARTTPSQNFLLQQFSHSSSIKRISMITTIQKTSKDWCCPLAFLLLFVCFISCSDDFEDHNILNESVKENAPISKYLSSENITELFKMVRNKEIPPLPLPPPRINQPPQRLFQTWLDQEKFEIWIDREKAKNESLSLRHSDEFSHFTVRGTSTNKIEYNSSEYRVDLMTNQKYTELQIRREELKKEYQENYPEIWERYHGLFTQKEL